MIRCPQCGHTRARVRMGTGGELHAVQVVGEHIICEVGSQRIALVPDDQLVCENCQCQDTLANWFVEHWDNMCECGGELWAVAVNGGRAVVLECDRCGKTYRHAFPT